MATVTASPAATTRRNPRRIRERYQTFLSDLHQAQRPYAAELCFYYQGRRAHRPEIPTAFGAVTTDQERIKLAAAIERGIISATSYVPPRFVPPDVPQSGVVAPGNDYETALDQALCAIDPALLPLFVDRVADPEHVVGDRDSFGRLQPDDEGQRLQLAALEAEHLAVVAAHNERVAAALPAVEPFAYDEQPRLTRAEIGKCMRCKVNGAGWVWHIGSGQRDMALCPVCVQQPRAEYPADVFTLAQYFIASTPVAVTEPEPAESGADAAAAPAEKGWRLPAYVATLTELEQRYASLLVQEANTPGVGELHHHWLYADMSVERARLICAMLAEITGLPLAWDDEATTKFFKDVRVRPTERTMQSTREFIRGLDKQINYAWEYYNYLVAGTPAPSWSTGPKEQIGFQIEHELCAPHPSGANGYHIDYPGAWRNAALAVDIAAELAERKSRKKQVQAVVAQAIADHTPAPERDPLTGGTPAEHAVACKRAHQPLGILDDNGVCDVCGLAPEPEVELSTLAPIPEYEPALAAPASPADTAEDGAEGMLGDADLEDDEDLGTHVHAVLLEHWGQQGYIEGSADDFFVDTAESIGFVEVRCTVRGASYRLNVSADGVLTGAGRDPVLLEVMAGDLAEMLYNNGYGGVRLDLPPVSDEQREQWATRLERGSERAMVLAERLAGLDAHTQLLFADSERTMIGVSVAHAIYRVQVDGASLNVLYSSASSGNPQIAATIERRARRVFDLPEDDNAPLDVQRAASAPADTPLETAIAASPSTPSGLHPSELAPYAKFKGQHNDPDGAQWAHFLASQGEALREYALAVVIELDSGRAWEPWLWPSLSEDNAIGVLRAIGKFLPFTTWWGDRNKTGRYHVRSTEASRSATRLYLDSLTVAAERRYALGLYNRWVAGDRAEPNKDAPNHARYTAIENDVLGLLFGKAHRNSGAIYSAERMKAISLGDLRDKPAPPSSAKGKGKGKGKQPSALDTAWADYMNLGLRLRADPTNEPLRNETRLAREAFNRLAEPWRYDSDGKLKAVPAVALLEVPIMLPVAVIDDGGAADDDEEEEFADDDEELGGDDE